MCFALKSSCSEKPGPGFHSDGLKQQSPGKSHKSVSSPLRFLLPLIYPFPSSSCYRSGVPGSSMAFFEGKAVDDSKPPMHPYVVIGPKFYQFPHSPGGLTNFHPITLDVPFTSGTLWRTPGGSEGAGRWGGVLLIQAPMQPSTRTSRVSSCCVDRLPRSEARR